MFNLVSLDGYYAGMDGNIDWHVVDDEFNQFAIEETQKFGVILFGRVTYKIFEDFWPKAVSDPKMSKEDLEIAKIINDIEKIVFSKTLEEVRETSEWKNVRLFKEIIPDEIQKLKKEPGKDMVIFGSGTIVQALTNFNLVDEYRLMVNPVILGKGKLLFKNVKKLNLKLISTKIFKSGNVLLFYKT